MKKQDVDQEKWVDDNISLDHKGKVPLRASTGVWKASLFLIVVRFCECFCAVKIVSSLDDYVFNVIHGDDQSYAIYYNLWTGVLLTMPIIGGYVADAYLGQFVTVLLSTLLCLLGLILLTMARAIPAFGPTDAKPCEDPQICREPQKAIGNLFFLAVFLILTAIAILGPCLLSFGADQFDDNHPTERKKRSSFFNWWNVGSYCGYLSGSAMVDYMQNHAGWYVAHISVISAIASTFVILSAGRPFYRFYEMKRSPLTPVFQVIIAAIAKRNLSFQSLVLPEKFLYEAPTTHTSKQRLLCHTNNYRFIDKAAIIEDTQNPTQQQSPWRLSPVTKVEEVKLIVSMTIIWLACIPFSMCTSRIIYLSTIIALQLKPFEYHGVPLLTTDAFNIIGVIISLIFYEKLLVPILRKKTKKECVISILQRVGIGMSISVLGGIVAAVVERMRYLVDKNSLGETSSMSILWILPHFLIMGIADGFILVGLQDYFYSQSPDWMRSSGITFYFTWSVAGGNLADFLFQKYLKTKKADYVNVHRLDLFLWLFAGICAINICVFAIIAKRCSYKNVMITCVAVSDCHSEGIVFF